DRARGGLRPALEDGRRPGQQPLLPVVDEGGVNAELGGDLVDRPVPSDGGQGDLRLERRRVTLPLRHRTTSRSRRSSLTGGPKSGVHYRLTGPGVLGDAGNEMLMRAFYLILSLPERANQGQYDFEWLGHRSPQGGREVLTKPPPSDRPNPTRFGEKR